jgi:hypothetical protein
MVIVSVTTMAVVVYLQEDGREAVLGSRTCTEG